VPDRVDLWVGACAQAGRVCKPGAYAGRVDARVGCAKPGVWRTRGSSVCMGPVGGGPYAPVALVDAQVGCVWTGRACEPRACVRGQSGRMGLICVLAVCVGRAVRVACVCFGGPGGVGGVACTVLYDDV